MDPTNATAKTAGAALPSLATERLLLRPWRAADRAPFAALNADPRVMEFFPSTLERRSSDSLAERIAAQFAARGFGLWAVEIRGGPAFVGFVGLSVPGFASRFTPCVEVGWRLAHAHWGKGYATEAARAALGHGFGVLGLAEIVSFTVAANGRSRAVMERLGMTRRPEEDFDHPSLPAGHALSRHVLYRLARREWQVPEPAAVTPAAAAP